MQQNFVTREFLTSLILNAKNLMKKNSGNVFSGHLEG